MIIFLRKLPDGTVIGRSLIREPEARAVAYHRVSPGAVLFGVPYVQWAGVAPGAAELKDGKLKVTDRPLQQLHRWLARRSFQ